MYAESERGPKDLHKYVSVIDLQAQLRINEELNTQIIEMSLRYEDMTKQCEQTQARLDEALTQARKLYDKLQDAEARVHQLENKPLLQRIKDVFKK